ncbi:hypothetical protein EDB85DRAFT_533549 [Lactarius pseudohatsudake]|nr:hypothetical protein EDB85DRAFT_533549 [Lactarius pseudohatsudake]
MSTRCRAICFSMKERSSRFVYDSQGYAEQIVTSENTGLCYESKAVHALMFSQSLSTVTLRHANVRFILVWTPVDQDLERQRVARHMASEACKREPPDGLDRVQSASFQKDWARRRTFQQWDDKWWTDTLVPAFNRRVLGEDSVPHSYRHAIVFPEARQTPPTLVGGH